MQIVAGQELGQDFVVQEQHTAAHLGSGSVQVLATPMMIAFMENTALKLLDRSLQEGYSSVGTRVDVRHLAPSALGSRIHVRAVVDQVDGHKVSLLVEAWDGDTPVGKGSHERFVIEVERFIERVQKIDPSGS